jgi:hypothetical protein
MTKSALWLLILPLALTALVLVSDWQVDPPSQLAFGFVPAPLPADVSTLGPAEVTGGGFVSTGQPDLTFSVASVPAIVYKLQVDDSADFASPVIDYTSESQAAGAKTFPVSPTLSDGDYYWRVQVTNSGTYSDWLPANSGQVAFRVDTTAPEPGTVTFSDITTTGFTATTTGASDAGSGLVASYVYHETVTDTYSDATSDAWTWSDLTPNTSYTIEVGVSDSLGHSATSSEISTTTLANLPANLTLSADSSSQITASWTANSNPAATEYYVENLTSGTNSGWSTSTSWISSGLTAATAYNFSVKARNSALVETAAVTGLETTSSVPISTTPS